MAHLRCKYLGLALRNPVIVSSSGLTDSIEKIKTLEQAGAGAVVLKSLFEEQIMHESGRLASGSDYPEAHDYIRNYVQHHNLEDYLTLIRQGKNDVKIPIIASINCTTHTEWVSFATEIEKAGADALEVNVYFVPTSKTKSSSDYEQLYFTLAEKLRATVKIPLSFKLGMHFTNLPYVVGQLANRKIDGVVLFNRFYAPDIDPEQMKITSAEVLSSPADIRQSLRWVGIVSGMVDNIEIAASTGIHDSQGVIKQILAGAHTVQVCSALYKNGLPYVGTLVEGLSQWMKTRNFNSVEEMRGSMGYKKIGDPASYERAQFMKYFSSLN